MRVLILDPVVNDKISRGVSEFDEAVMNGCNIITQSSNGFMVLYLSKNYFHCADCVDTEELAKGLLEVKDNYFDIPIEEKKRFVEYMSFSRTAKEYKEIVWKQK